MKGYHRSDHAAYVTVVAQPQLQVATLFKVPHFFVTAAAGNDFHGRAIPCFLIVYNAERLCFGFFREPNVGTCRWEKGIRIMSVERNGKWVVGCSTLVFIQSIFKAHQVLLTSDFRR